MKNTLTLIALCLFLIGKLTAQNGQNIVFNLTKKNKNLTLESLKISKTGMRGVGSFTTTPLLVALKNPEPFIAFSMSIDGNRLVASLITIELQTQIEGKWQEWQPIKADHDFDQNAKMFVSNIRELDKATSAIRLRVNTKSGDMRLKSIKIRLFAPGNISTGNLIPLTPETLLCTKPPAVSRTVWGAAWSLTDDKIYSGSPTFVNVTHLVIHHSAENDTLTRNGTWAAVVAAYFDFHINVKLFSDIAYNYLIAPDGTLFVGRGGGDNVQGAHMCARNANTMGVCMIGNYVSNQPSAAALDKLVQIMAWKASQRGIDVLGTSLLANYGINLANLCGHSDGCATGYTECPGDLLWAQLPTIRQRVKTAVTTCVAATNDLFTEGSVRIAPNPNNGQFQISAILKEQTNSLPLNLVVYSLDGKMVFQKTIDNIGMDFNQTIQLPNAVSGLYVLHLRSGERAFSEKIQVF